ncbi:putative thioredoxin-like ferredoxin [Rosa chinensis]|uniref:Putative thioredoxin-like ferredoxin n=2 Tax=Rosa chinensis TaxID=74649 RepID=A0A2P6S5T9_ROSCH|nr:putative thioredoxin-like ferredoxin [Rosa chinensis]
MRIANPHSFRFLTTVTNRYLFLSSQPRSPTLLPQTLAMASDDLSTLPSAADDEKYGFKRPEMFQSKLAGTVDAYDRHVFLCYKSPEAWPARVEGSESDPLPKLLSSAFKARKNDISIKTKLTVCEGRDGTEFADGDVLIFPDMIKYRGLKESDVDSFVDDVIVNDKAWASGAREVLTGSHVFVCAHGSRDRRCGVCGPVLIDKFIEEAELRGLKDQVFVSPCSHIGGHKYAGNLIIYSPGADGKITGHWYGYVAPDDVPELLDEHIGKGKIIERLWRGEMGVSAEEAEKVNEHKLPNGESEKFKDQKLPIGEGSKKSKENPQENGTQIQNSNDNFAGCCQGANGVSCCRDGNLEQNSGIEEKKQKETTEASSGKKDAVGCKLTSYMGKWEQSDILAAVAVVGAVATVGVAVYSFYRRSG